MAITRNSNGGTIARKSGASSYTQSANNVAGNLLVVGIAVNSNSDLVTGVTYNGVAMTQAVKLGTANSEYSYFYYLASPATGSNNIVISLSSTVTIDMGWASYSGTNSSPLDLTVSNSVGSAATITETINTATANCWMVAFSGLQRQTTASTNSTFVSGNSASGGSIYDSNGTISTGGYTMTQNVVGTGPCTSVAMTIKPAISAVNSSFLMFM